MVYINGPKTTAKIRCRKSHGTPLLLTGLLPSFGVLKKCMKPDHISKKKQQEEGRVWKLKKKRKHERRRWAKKKGGQNDACENKQDLRSGVHDWGKKEGPQEKNTVSAIQGGRRRGTT